MVYQGHGDDESNAFLHSMCVCIKYKTHEQQHTIEHLYCLYSFIWIFFQSESVSLPFSIYDYDGVSWKLGHWVECKSCLKGSHSSDCSILGQHWHLHSEALTYWKCTGLVMNVLLRCPCVTAAPDTNLYPNEVWLCSTASLQTLIWNANKQMLNKAHLSARPISWPLSVAVKVGASTPGQRRRRASSRRPANGNGSLSAVVPPMNIFLLQWTGCTAC